MIAHREARIFKVPRKGTEELGHIVYAAGLFPGPVGECGVCEGSLFPVKSSVPCPNMQNDEGKIVDLYIPRKCSATNRLIDSADHAAVQINIPHVDANGAIIPGEFTPFVISGVVRLRGKSDSSINSLATAAGFLKNVIQKP